ncbi:MAG: efflux RND transporter permease subunit [Desulfomonilaceae bacterium]|nr:efflux RND transporter permease subunit [Desulfomonilaceae bacterium]
MSKDSEVEHTGSTGDGHSFFSKIIRFFLEQKLLVAIFIVGIVTYGLVVAPFDWELSFLPRNPVPVDAIPDIGENQQIVFTNWPGRSPQDVEDQITYPLTVSLLGIPGVRTIRSFSYFGFSTIYVVFTDDVDFYWSRTRILEKLNSLPTGTLPEGVQPALGPDATALGQIFWYTLEGDGFSLHELRTIQDWYVRYYLQAAEGVSEVASVGGYVREYQIDIDPDAMRAHRITLPEIVQAVMKSNVDVGARTIEMNKAEYVIRGLGFIQSVEDIEETPIKVKDNVPLAIKDVAVVHLGPALRRGALDKEGAEVVGGVAVVRYGENPLKVIKNVKKKIDEIAPGLPSKTLPDGSVSQVEVVPFYDRTTLIHETLDTLKRALSEEILVTIIVVIVMVNHLAGSTLVSGLLPLAVLMTFIGMKHTGVDANIMALSGIAIAIGTMVDMGIVLYENILRHLKEASSEENKLEVIHRATTEVGPAVLTAVSTTVVSFLPVFALTGAEGKLFGPVAYTKTYALLAALIVALVIIPPLAHTFFTGKPLKPRTRTILHVITIMAGLGIGYSYSWWIGTALIMLGAYNVFVLRLPENKRDQMPNLANLIAVAVVVFVLTEHWLPLGPEVGPARNLVFVVVLIFGLLAIMKTFQWGYRPVLIFCLDHKIFSLTIPVLFVLLGITVWMGFNSVFGFFPNAVEWALDGGKRVVTAQHVHDPPTKTDAPMTMGMPDDPIRKTRIWQALSRKFPGLGKEFMPALDEGSFLFMPTTMPHASITQASEMLKQQNMYINQIPEVESVVGKLGRVESALDPAPVSMFETVINYLPEYKTDPKTGKRELDPKTGKPIRNWRPHIKSPDDIWKEILKAADLPGTTSAPKLQPIAARIVMLQSGMRAPMGLKLRGTSLEELERVGLRIEQFLKEVPSIEPASVVADRVVGKPYLEIKIDRKKIARYGVNIRDVQDVIEIAIGGRPITTTVEGRERYPVRVRYLRELRDSPEDLENILVAGEGGAQVPLKQVAEIRYVRGPMVIKSEDTFLVSYVIFDKKAEKAEVDVVQDAAEHLRHKIADGDLKLPKGFSYVFAGSYENQVRSEETLRVVVPVALVLILLILYFQFRSVPTSVIVFSGIFVAWSGGFIMIWLYAQPWFMDFSVFGVSMRELFQIRNYNLSVAVWVGFLALFGIAADHGVIFCTYLDQVFTHRKPESVQEIREATVEAAMKRIRPALMTAATTILALIPVLTSTGRGADVMVPMALPSFGGMTLALMTVFVVPTLYCLMKEMQLKRESTT